MAVAEIIVEDIKCKDCGSTAVVKFGSYKGVQRYYCKACKRKFKADNDLFHMKVPADYVSSALSMYYSGMSVNDICTTLKQEHNYYPSNSIVYKWIEKYTPIAINHFRDYHPQVGDVWIADETVLNLDGEHSIWFYDIIDKTKIPPEKLMSRHRAKREVKGDMYIGKGMVSRRHFKGSKPRRGRII